jgi:hypothetical protein
MKTNLVESIQRHFGKDISLMLTFGYLFLIMIGMIFNAVFYAINHLNIFKYAEISDFLLAPFRDFYILIFTALSIAIILGFYQLDEYLELHYPKFHHKLMMGRDKSKYQLFYETKGVLLLIGMYIILAAWNYGMYRSVRLDRRQISLERSIFKENKFNPTDTLYYLGNTNQYFFIKNASAQECYVIPKDDLIRLCLQY